MKIETDFTEHDSNASNDNYENTAIENNQNDTFEVHMEEFKETILDLKGKER